MKQVVNAINLKLWHEQTCLASPSKSSSSPPVSPSKRSNSPPLSPSTPPTASTSNESSCLHTLPSALVWIEDLGLTTADKELLLSDAWLSDRIIDAVNALVSQCIGSERNQSTVLAQSQVGFDPVYAEFIQILHDKNHWVTTAVIGDDVIYADSLNRSAVSKTMARQMKQLYALKLNKSGQLNVAIVPCAKQPNAHDCGLYAAAFAFQLAAGDENTGEKNLDRSFITAKMRLHLSTCLALHKVIPFPATRTRKRGRIMTTLTVVV